MSDDLINRLRDIQGQAGLFASAAADRIEELEADLAEAMELELALTSEVVNLRTYAPCLVDGPEHDVGYYYGYHTALGSILDLLAELTGGKDE